MEVFETLIGSGGWVGAVVLAIFIGKQLLDAWLAKRRDDREEKSGDVVELTTAVGNASTVNAIMTKSIETLAAENSRLETRVATLEHSNEAKDAKIAERDATIEQLKKSLQEWVARGQEYVQQITTYQELLRQQDPEVE
jgi:septal ring factor EnvC (AmiA/AmiB activator)